MGRIVLAWDAPNVDMTLAQLLGRRPGAGDRPDMRAVRIDVDDGRVVTVRSKGGMA